MAFPPIPRYPLALDNDFTLFEVFNTSEAPLSTDNDAWAAEISIVPQDREMWGENGFLNLSDELIYYDGVDRDSFNRVIRFKNCLRGMNGHSFFNVAGTIIRGPVVAEQHNQMVLAIIKTEKFIGYNFDPDPVTLDWRIRNLQAQPRIADDFACPEVQFDFDVLSSDTATGTLISYSATITGNYGSAVVSFGDGQVSTTLTGTHLYSVNSRIDPSITVQNGDCQIIQTPIERTEIAAPEPPTPTLPFTVPVPVAPTFPTLIFPSAVLPSLDLLPPPFVDSCLDLSPLNNLPSIFANFFDDFLMSLASIVVPSINFPGVISLQIPSNLVLSVVFPSIPSIPVVVPSGTSIPVTVPPGTSIPFGPVPVFPDIGFDTPPTFAPISFDTPPSIPFGPSPLPSQIDFGPNPLPNPINFGPNPLPTQVPFGPNPLPAQIPFGPNPLPTQINIVGNFTSVISVDWGTPPSIVCTCVVVCPSGSPMAARESMWEDAQANEIEVNYDMGIPSVIQILTPDRPIRIENTIPSVIEVAMPSEVRITGAEYIPQEIRVVAPRRDEMVFTVQVQPTEFAPIQVVGMPSMVSVDFPSQLPLISFDTRTFPSEIRVTGMPHTIQVVHNVPTRIEVDWSEAARAFSFPAIKVEPVEVKFNFDRLGISASDETQCFALIPCKR